MINRRKFLHQWVPPVVVGISLPVHAELTTVSFPTEPLLYRASVSNNVCDDQATPPRASFTFCNEESGEIIIEKVFISKIGVPDSLSPATNISPSLPVTIPASGCVDFEITGRSGSIYRCGDSLTLAGRHIDPDQLGYFTFPI